MKAKLHPPLTSGGDEPDETVSATSLAEKVYEDLKRDILNAELTPDTKLRVEFVSRRYGIGSSPVREALTRLAAEGFVRREMKRGFFVARVSSEDLHELTETRCWLEDLALRRSILTGGSAWEEEIVLAFHRFSRTTRPPSGAALTADSDWVVKHERFHDVLIAACGSRWLIDFCRHLRWQAYRYRRISSNERSDRWIEEHEAIMRATLDRKGDLAADLLLAHYRRSEELALHRKDLRVEEEPLALPKRLP